MRSSTYSPSDSSATKRAFFAFLTFAFWKNWFFRPCGGYDVLKLALPIVVSSGSVAAMELIDNMFLAWLDPQQMSGAFQSGNLLWALITFPTCVAAFSNTFVSQYEGSKSFSHIGRLVWQGVFFGLFCGVLFVAATPLIGRLFHTLTQSSEIANYSKTYWFYFSLGACATVGVEPLGAYFYGMGKSRTVMYVGLAAVLLNLCLDPILIFGINGKFRLGVAGAAIASAVAMQFKFILLLVLVLHHDRSGKRGVLRGFRFNLSEMKKLLVLGSESAVQETMENIFFAVFVLLMGWLGDNASEATSIAFCIDYLVLMTRAGLGIATQTLTGNQIGAQRFDLVKRSVYTSLAIGLVISCIFSALFLCVPERLLDLYDAKATAEFAPIRELTVHILRFVATYLFADTIIVVFLGALRGAGDAKIIAYLSPVLALITFAVMFVGVGRLNKGVYWCWGCLACYLYSNAIILFARFLYGKWRSIDLTSE